METGKSKSKKQSKGTNLLFLFFWFWVLSLWRSTSCLGGGWCFLLLGLTHLGNGNLKSKVYA